MELRVASQRWILKGEQSELPTPIAATESVLLFVLVPLVPLVAPIAMVIMMTVVVV